MDAKWLTGYNKLNQKYIDTDYTLTGKNWFQKGWWAALEEVWGTFETLEEVLTILKAWENWEADWIKNDEAWSYPAFPVLPSVLYHKLVLVLQGQRQKSIERVEEAKMKFVNACLKERDYGI